MLTPMSTNPECRKAHSARASGRAADCNAVAEVWLAMKDATFESPTGISAGQAPGAPADSGHMGFTVYCPLARHRLPRIQFLSIGSRFCSTLLSDPASRRRPCASLSPHLHQVVKRAFTSRLLNVLGTQ